MGTARAPWWLWPSYLRALGKEPRIVVAPALPAFLVFLDPGGLGGDLQAADDRHRDLATWPEAWVLVDASEPHRMGVLQPVFRRLRGREGLPGPPPEGAHPRASTWNARIPRPAPAPNWSTTWWPRAWPGPCPTMVAALYAGLVDDTGNFRFSNTTPKVHRMAAALIEAGSGPRPDLPGSLSSESAGTPAGSSARPSRA